MSFTAAKIKKKIAKNKIPEVFDCKACPRNNLETLIRSPKMQPTGSLEPTIYIIGESPGCISGDSLIEVAFRDKTIYPNGIPIKDLVGEKDFYVYSFDTNTSKITLGKVKKVWCTGIKKTYKVSYEWNFNKKDSKTLIYRDSLRVTSNHKFLLRKQQIKDPFKGINKTDGYLSIDEGITIGNSLQPFFRSTNLGYSFIKDHSSLKKREGRFLLEYKIGRKLLKNEQCHHIDGNKLNDSIENLELLDIKEHSYRHMLNRENPMFNESIRQKHLQIAKSIEFGKKVSIGLKERFKNPEALKKRKAEIESYKDRIKSTLKNNYNNPLYYYNYLLSRKKNKRIKNFSDERIFELFKKRFPYEPFPKNENNHKIISIEYFGYEKVYDIEVEKYNNFATQGVFVHNSKEDAEGYQFAGQSGDIVRPLFENLFGSYFMNTCIRWNNIVRCFNDNITPNLLEIECCKPELLRDIEKTKPLVVVGFGAVPLKTFFDREKISLWRGRMLPLQVGSHTCWYFPMNHPAFILRNRDKNGTSEVEKEFNRDIERIFDFIEEGYESPKVEKSNYGEGIGTYLEDFNIEKMFSILNKTFENDKYLAVDIETNVLKPYVPEAKILSIAFSNGKNTIAIPFTNTDYFIGEMRNKVLLDGLYQFMISREHLIAHNLKFELEWFFYFFKNQDFMRKVQWHDTMLQAYLLDERTTKEEGEGMLNLDILIRNNFGFNLKALSNIPKDEIESVPLDKLLMYNGLDAKYTYKLFKIQTPKVNAEFRESYLNLISTVVTIVVTQNYGLLVDLEKTEELLNKYKSRLIEINDTIQNRPEIVKYKTLVKDKVFNPMSPKDLVYIFEQLLNLPPIKATKKGGYSVDNEVLSFHQKKGVELADLIIQYRTTNKLKSTYVELVKATQVYGIVHPQFNPIGTTTGRLSSGKE